MGDLGCNFEVYQNNEVKVDDEGVIHQASKIKVLFNNVHNYTILVGVFEFPFNATIKLSSWHDDDYDT